MKRGASCCSAGSCCCGTGQAKEIGKKVGYSDSDMDVVPEGANLGFGCGNPVALASLKEGDVVLDLGSGAGFDAFLSAQRVGKTGRVIGVDMTPEMVAKAKENAKKGNHSNVEFRLGEIEKLPVGDDSIDVIISNCVINLSPDKETVFKEAYRVLKAGGRLMVSDLVLAKDLPKEIKDSVEAYVGCLAGAVKKNEYLELISIAGFQDVKVISESSYPVDAMFDNLKQAQDAVVSIKVSAIK
ncbi:MAG: arsenite methyltransferase [Candidatus Omnitrophota bacterium]